MISITTFINSSLLVPNLNTPVHFKVKRRGERVSALPEDLDWTVYLTEAQKAIVTGNIETALTCAHKVPATNLIILRSYSDYFNPFS